MSLMKQMTAMLATMLLILFAGTCLITLNNARNFFIEQLNSNARDTATSLGLSLSQALDKRDRPGIQSMVKVVFGHDDFSMIEVRDQKGNLLVSQYERSSEQSAPAWFVDLIEWPSSVQSFTVMADGRRVGEVLVTSDSRLACHALWRNAMQLLYWFLIFALLFLLVVIFMMRVLFAPLKRITIQAERIAKGNLTVETNISATSEFRKLTLLMNQMVNDKVLGRDS